MMLYCLVPCEKLLPEPNEELSVVRAVMVS